MLSDIDCETNPKTGALSRTTEPFHAKAIVTVGSYKTNLRHVCEDCCQRYHRHLKRREGIHWE